MSTRRLVLAECVKRRDACAIANVFVLGSQGLRAQYNHPLFWASSFFEFTHTQLLPKKNQRDLERERKAIGGERATARWIQIGGFLFLDFRRERKKNRDPISNQIWRERPEFKPRPTFSLLIFSHRDFSAQSLSLHNSLSLRASLSRWKSKTKKPTDLDPPLAVALSLFLLLFFLSLNPAGFFWVIIGCG